MRWDIFCHVVDNFGDAGVCWRLACDLAERGEAVRLWIDDAAPLAWMAPSGGRGVEVVPWAHPPARIGDVVIEAFGCTLPDAVIAAMAAAPQRPLWINLEYLTAEPFAERAHGLPSPQLAGPGAGLAKWFFYPGFTPATGGLLRERTLLARQSAFDAAAWLGAHGITRRQHERVVTLFCYPHAPVAALIDTLAADGVPTLLLATAGGPAAQVDQALGSTRARGALRAVALPYLSQTDFDHLLWSSDLNLVRGEDSIVRALWAGRALLWQLYPQSDGAHARKLDAFLRVLLAPTDAEWTASFTATSLRWNGLNGDGPATPLPLPALEPWAAAVQRLRVRLLAQPDLSTRLLAFAADKRVDDRGAS